MPESVEVALIYPSGLPQLSEQEVENRKKYITEQGFQVTELANQLPNYEYVTAGLPLERAVQLSLALTRRNLSVVWAARGGYGATSLLPYLRNMLPPALPPQVLVGFSDTSFLGLLLSLRYSEISYVHSHHFFSKALTFSQAASSEEQETLLNLCRGEQTSPRSFQAEYFGPKVTHQIEGYCIPANLTLLDSLAGTEGFAIPENSVLFVEDVGEPLYKVLRSFDGIRNSAMGNRITAVVVGEFTGTSEYEEDRKKFCETLERHLRLPVISLPIFGHGDRCFPLVALSKTTLVITPSHCEVELSFTKSSPPDFSYWPFIPRVEEGSQVHFTGVGGTGMASVAGLAKLKGFEISGSDQPIFPPMSKVIEGLGLKPYVGYEAKNIDAAKPDLVVLANAITRSNAQLKPNLEFDAILDRGTPMLSFPSFLRGGFLQDSTNLVITGTHGKTTTSSLATHLLKGLDLDPSYMIGGAPRNFDKPFHYGGSGVFVLEADEYDSALFDKGPKFLHYEPDVCVIGNIEFDHADIYENLEAILAEFRRLVELVARRSGVICYNSDDEIVRGIVADFKGVKIPFSGLPDPSIEGWQLMSLKTQRQGSRLEVKAPWGEVLQLESKVFGHFNALNTLAALAAVHAYAVKPIQASFTSRIDFSKHSLTDQQLDKLRVALASFQGVRRRFELIGVEDDVAVFDDFAHHPTAISATLKAFRSYMEAADRKGKLIACFEPRNATMRRNLFEDQLVESLKIADRIVIGKVPQDQRIDAGERMNGEKVAKQFADGSYFEDHDQLVNFLGQELSQGDTVVFMGASGAFNGVYDKILSKLRNRNSSAST